VTLTNQEAIQQIAETLGLPSELRPGKRNCWIKTNSLNGIWFELEVVKKGRLWRVIVEYGNPENCDIIYNGLPELEPALCGGAVHFNCADAEELLETALKVKEFIITNNITRASRSAKLKTSDEGYFEGTATVLKVAAELQQWSFFDRDKCGFDDHDELITVGKSKAFEAAKALDPDYSGWREHIIPCTLIRDEFIQMVEAGATVAELAQMLKTNLAIVMITPEEAALIDSTYKTTMPDGWNFGDSVFARLDAMGVDY